MSKVYITRKKKLNEDIAINDPTLAQQYLAVRKQITDKQQKKDQLMRQVAQIDSEINILEKNSLAIQTKAAQQQDQPAPKAENQEKPAENMEPTEGGEQNEQ